MDVYGESTNYIGVVGHVGGVDKIDFWGLWNGLINEYQSIP